MSSPETQPEKGMTFLEHLEELRSRLFRIAVAFAVAFVVCWIFCAQILRFFLAPIKDNLFGGGDIIFIYLTEPFMVYMKAAALAAIFLSAPYVLMQIWGFVSPGLYARERRMGVGFIVFGTFFFVLGGLFGYYVLMPMTAHWLIALGGDFKAQLTLESAFQFESHVLIGLGLVFQLPIVIFFLARLGVVTPGFLLKHFRIAVLLITIAAAVITPTGDALTMSVFAAPMIVLYLLGVLVAWLFEKRPGK